MTKYSTEFKVKVVKAYFNGDGSFEYLAKKFNMANSSAIKRWVDLTREQGYSSLQVSHRRNNYTADFKLKVVTYYRTHEVGGEKVAAKFKLHPSQVYSWYRRYQKEGIIGLRPKPKSRPVRDMNKQKNKRNLNQLSMTKEEQYKQKIADLQAKLAYAKMENDILKKLQALRQQEEKDKH